VHLDANPFKYGSEMRDWGQSSTSSISNWGLGSALLLCIKHIARKKIVRYETLFL